MMARSAAIVGVLGALAVTPAAANPPCEPLRPVRGALGYRDRGTRCEGIYVLDTASAVRLKAIVVGSPVVEASIVSLSPVGTPPAGKYVIRVSSIDPLEHYQLDAEVEWPGTFAWSAAEILGPAKVSVGRLAPLAWSSTGTEPLYVPVRFGVRTGADAATPSAVAAAAASPASIEVLVESTAPFEAFRAVLRRRGVPDPVVLEPAGTRSPSTYAFTIPRGSGSGAVELWMTWRLRGASQPDSAHWRIWLP